jgi:hypothetical protein
MNRHICYPLLGVNNCLIKYWTIAPLEQFYCHFSVICLYWWKNMYMKMYHFTYVKKGTILFCVLSSNNWACPCGSSNPIVLTGRRPQALLDSKGRSSSKGNDSFVAGFYLICSLVLDIYFSLCWSRKQWKNSPHGTTGLFRGFRYWNTAETCFTGHASHVTWGSSGGTWKIEETRDADSFTPWSSQQSTSNPSLTSLNILM